jgi:hypothetical protein
MGCILPAASAISTAIAIAVAYFTSGSCSKEEQIASGEDLPSARAQLNLRWRGVAVLRFNSIHGQKTGFEINAKLRIRPPIGPAFFSGTHRQTFLVQIIARDPRTGL